MNRIACLLLGVVVVLSVGRCLAAPARSAESAIVRANRGFAVDLYGQLAKENQGKDLFFSPYSISTALAMTSAGARGNTATQMAKTLHLDLDAAAVHPAFASVAASLKEEGQARLGPNGPTAFELVVANALWGQQGYPFKADFLNLVKADYGSELRTVDFAKAVEPARATINQWVAAQTKDKIQELIARPADPRYPPGADQRYLLQGQVAERIPEGRHGRQAVQRRPRQDDPGPHDATGAFPRLLRRPESAGRGTALRHGSPVDGPPRAPPGRRAGGGREGLVLESGCLAGRPPDAPGRYLAAALQDNVLLPPQPRVDRAGHDRCLQRFRGRLLGHDQRREAVHQRGRPQGLCGRR